MKTFSRQSVAGKIVAACLLTAAFVSHFAARDAAAAELRLRAQSSAAGPVVTLGDVAEIVSADARQTAALAAIELFPAPAAAEQRIVRVREIQDLLLLHGVNLTEHRFSGSSEVTVQAVVARPRAAASKPVPAADTQRIKRRVCEVLVKYLSERVDHGSMVPRPDLVGRFHPERRAGPPLGRPAASDHRRRRL